jgi:simple sugar transport system ATP-binding protein
MTLSENVILSRHATGGVVNRGLVDLEAAKALADEIVTAFDVRRGRNDPLAGILSGGNLQKFIVGREIDANPRVLIVSQPTWGVDVGAAAQIRGEILRLRESGCAVLVVSEELDELFEICDRLQVLAKGRLSPSIDIAQATVEKIGEWMSGLWHEEVQAHLHIQEESLDQA